MPTLPTVQVGHLQVPDVRALFPDTTSYARRPLSAVTTIVIHHSVTAGGETSEQDELRTIRAIYDYHTLSNEWPGVGYHCCVFPSGRTYLTGGVEDVRYHVREFNPESYGVCLIGDFSHQAPGPPQLTAVARLVAELQYGLGKALAVVGHQDLMQTTCPGGTWSVWRRQVDSASAPTAQPDTEDFLDLVQQMRDRAHADLSALDRIEQEYHQLLRAGKTG